MPASSRRARSKPTPTIFLPLKPSGSRRKACGAAVDDRHRVALVLEGGGQAGTDPTTTDYDDVHVCCSPVPRWAVPRSGTSGHPKPRVTAPDRVSEDDGCPCTAPATCPPATLSAGASGVQAGGELLAQGEGGVLLAGVGPVLELDDADLGEALAQPAVVGVEQAELLAVGHDLGEQHLLERILELVAAHALDDLGFGSTPMRSHTSLLQEAVAHAHGGLEGELLALAQLGVGQLGVVLLQRQHAEGHVAGLVAHHVAQQLLEQRLGRSAGA